MAKYSGKLRSKDEELSCECEGTGIERKLNEYQKHMQKCMLGFRPSGRSVEENNRRMRQRFTECAKAYR